MMNIKAIVQVNQNFDAGNIEVVSIEHPSNIQLKIRMDNKSNFYQWFYFRLSGAKHTPCTLKILNGAEASYPDGFKNYRVLYSYNRKEWLRHGTTLKNGVLSIDFTPLFDAVYFAYFVPYSMERHHDMIAISQQVSHCSHQVLGQTLDGQDLDLLKLSIPNYGKRTGKKNCWMIARQHPGETMAEWWMEGCIEKLLDNESELTRALLKQCDIYLVPNMNPDGSRRGHLRTNAAGCNLNREWATPTLKASAEVFLVKEAMAEVGVDFLLDVHGDESLPYCFIAGTEGLNEWNDERQAQLDFYRNRLAEINADFQTTKGYPRNPQGEANMTMSTVQIAHLHNCLAMTLEMPFKDTTATPDQIYGWSTDRCKRLAHSCLLALNHFLESDL